MTATPTAAAPGLSAPEKKAQEPDPAQWVAEYGDVLFRFALARVRRREVAEDLVQEALLAAWRSRDRFQGRSSQKTWLLQILKHKIVDHLRKFSREIGMADSDELAALVDQQFATGASGPTHWSKGVGPRNWSQPDQSLENNEFWITVHNCSERLPERVGRAFVLRDVDGLESDEICQILDIKHSHFFVLLHRARLALRRCLELNWFRNPKPPTNQET